MGMDILSDGTIRDGTGFTGKGKSKRLSNVILIDAFVLYNHVGTSHFLITTLLSLSCLVCKDGSCRNIDACDGARIPYVIGPSCTGGASCFKAQIGSAFSSCKEVNSCYYAQLSGAVLINSCNEDRSCEGTNENPITELNGFCNERNQCERRVGNEIIAAGCVSYMFILSLLLLIATLFVSNDSFFSHSYIKFIASSWSWSWSTSSFSYVSISYQEGHTKSYYSSASS